MVVSDEVLHPLNRIRPWLTDAEKLSVFPEHVHPGRTLHFSIEVSIGAESRLPTECAVLGRAGRHAIENHEQRAIAHLANFGVVDGGLLEAVEGDRFCHLWVIAWLCSAAGMQRTRGLRRSRAVHLADCPPTAESDQEQRKGSLYLQKVH